MEAQFGWSEFLKGADTAVRRWGREQGCPYPRVTRKRERYRHDVQIQTHCTPPHVFTVVGGNEVGAERGDYPLRELESNVDIYR
jgi:hypothetical protein